MELIKWLIENNKKLTSFFIGLGAFVIISAWPITTSVLYLERVGYFKSQDQVRYELLEALQKLQNEKLGVMGDKLDSVYTGVLENRSIFNQWLEEYSWQAKRTCINTAKTDVLRDECTKPRWRRDDKG